MLHRWRRRRFIRTLVDIQDLMDTEAVEWGQRMRALKSGKDPTAGLGFTGVVIPNSEPIADLAATTGTTNETNLYTPATTSNAAFGILPIGAIRTPQAYRVVAHGVVTSITANNTIIFTTRLGTSATPAANSSVGATGALQLGNNAANALWWYEGHGTVRTWGTNSSWLWAGNVEVGLSAGGTTATSTGLFGNVAGTADTTIQTGVVLSTTASATAVSVKVQGFTLVAWD